MKFGRIYELRVQGRDEEHTIAFPLTCRFRVTNNSLFSCGSAVIQIYNLTQEARNDIYKDAFEIATYKQVVLSAGYVANTANPGAISIPIIFQGNVVQASSYRQGTDWITEIQALDGGFALDTGSINLTKPIPQVQPRVDFEDIMTNLVAAMPRVKLGTIGTFDIARSRGVSFSGSPWDYIVRSVAPMQGQAFINKEVVNIVQQWEYVAEDGLLETISPEEGMIGTPRVQDGLVKIRMIFEPRLEVAQKIKIQTSEIPSAQLKRGGDFKVLNLLHGGTISGAVCEELITEATLYQPERTLVAA